MKLTQFLRADMDFTNRDVSIVNVWRVGSQDSNGALVLALEVSLTVLVPGCKGNYEYDTQCTNNHHRGPFKKCLYNNTNARETVLSPEELEIFVSSITL